MECPRGSQIRETGHEVKTLDKAKDWYTGVEESDLPLRISQLTALNGRCMIKVFNKNNELIHHRG